MQLNVNDIILTKKPHPCGASNWVVIRVGADVKIKCLGCGRIVMLTPSELSKRLKKVVTE